MPKFAYQATNENGETLSGTLEAETVEMASHVLVSQGFIPIEVTAEREKGAGFSLASLNEMLSTVKPPDLILFTKQFRTMMRAGLSILNLLETLNQQTENLKLKKTASAMSRAIREGAGLYDAFRQHPKVFSNLYCSMVRAGESSGSLTEVLERLAYILDHEHKVKTEIKAALQYPIIVIVFLTVAFFVLLTFVIPKFVAIFLAAGIDLPLPTKICMNMYDFLKNQWVILIGGTVAAVVGLYYYFKTEQGRFVRDSTLLRIPIIGPLFLKSAMSRFSSIFAILQASGVGVLESFRILSGTIGNSAISREFDLVKDMLEEGRGISEPLKRTRHFPPMVVNMVSIGEESGNLEEMLNEVSQHYDYEVEYATKRLADAIGPILTIGLAAVVGFFALAIFLPMWDLTKMVK